MKLVIPIFFLLVSSSYAQTSTDIQIKFRIKQLASGIYDFSSIWNEEQQTATIRTNLISVTIDDRVLNKTINVIKDQPITIELLSESEFLKNCDVVNKLNFEYVPQLPEYLVFLTLKGAECKTKAEKLVSKKIRLKFNASVTDENNNGTTAPIIMDFEK